MSGAGLKKLSGTVVLPIALLYFRDGTDDQLFEYRRIKISKLLEIQATLAHPVPANPGQQGSLFLSLSQHVDNQFPAPDSKAR